VTVLLGHELVELYPPGEADAHGWTEPGDRPAWCGVGNLQLGPGASDPQAADGGGHGPQAPAAAATGTMYLPPDCGAVEGSTARARGQWWALSQLRVVADPADTGLDCLVATATGRRTDGG
jgi:hypothetical protein